MRPSLRERIVRGARHLAHMARSTIGIGDYDAYVAHVRAHHPQCVPMSREAYCIERMQARYGKGRARCC